MDPANSIYYTLSTIAQVLAAFLALSGVFVIGKIREQTDIQISKLKSMIQLSDNIHEYVLNLGLLQEIKRNLKLIQSISESSIPHNSIFFIDNLLSALKPNFCNPMLLDLYNIYSATKLTITQIETMKKILKFVSVLSIAVGVIIISYSFIILANTHKVFIREHSNTILFVAIFFAIDSIILMFIAIVLSITDFQNSKFFPKVIRLYRIFFNQI